MAYRGTGVPQFGYNELFYGEAEPEQITGSWLNAFAIPIPTFASTSPSAFEGSGIVTGARVRVALLATDQLVVNNTYILEFTPDFLDATVHEIYTSDDTYGGPGIQLIIADPVLVDGKKYSISFVANSNSETSISIHLDIAAGGHFNVTGFSLREFTATPTSEYDLPHPIKGGRTEFYEPVQKVYENILGDLIAGERLLRFIGEYEFSQVPAATLDILTNMYNTKNSFQWAPHKDLNKISYQVRVEDYNIIPVNGLIGIDGLKIKVRSLSLINKIPTQDNMIRLTNYPKMGSIL